VASDWLIIELSDLGDSADYAELHNSLEEMLGELDFFIPIHNEQMGSYTSTSVLFEGYVFVKDSQEARSRLSEMDDYRFFSRLLENNGRIQTVNSKTIGVLKRKLKNSAKKRIRRGTMVKVIEGTFENLVGEVVSTEDQGRQAMVKIERLSREIIAPLPCTSLIVLED